MNKVEVLSRSPLFEMLSTPELEFVADLSRPRRFAVGEIVFEEGELGDSLFVIVEGEAEVLRKNDEGQLKVLTTLKAPSFFGEMSLIDKEYRSASVRAKSEALFRNQYRDGFTFLVINIARVLSGRLRDANTRLAARL